MYNNKERGLYRGDDVLYRLQFPYFIQPKQPRVINWVDMEEEESNFKLKIFSHNDNDIVRKCIAGLLHGYYNNGSDAITMFSEYLMTLYYQFQWKINLITDDYNPKCNIVYILKTLKKQHLLHHEMIICPHTQTIDFIFSVIDVDMIFDDYKLVCLDLGDLDYALQFEIINLLKNLIIVGVPNDNYLNYLNSTSTSYSIRYIIPHQIDKWDTRINNMSYQNFIKDNLFHLKNIYYNYHPDKREIFRDSLTNMVNLQKLDLNNYKTPILENNKSIKSRIDQSKNQPKQKTTKPFYGKKYNTSHHFGKFSHR
jgi:hypothetical protein